MTLSTMPSTVYDSVFNSTVVAQVASVTADAQVKEWIGRYSGGVDPQQIGVINTEPKFSIETSDISGALSAADVVAGTYYTGSTIKLPWNKRVEGGAFAATLQHAVISATRGLLIPTEFSATQDSEEGVKASLEFYPVWDGTNPIVGYTTATTLAAATFQSMFALSLVEPNSGAALNFVKSVTVRPGITVECSRYSGSPYPTICYITLREPEIEVEFEDFDALQANFFTSLTSLVVFFQQLADGSDRDDAANTDHVKFTLTGGLQITRSASGRGQDNATASLLFKGKTLAVATGVAIT